MKADPTPAPMSLLTHAFIALSYLALAVGLGLGLPELAPEVSAPEAVSLGAMAALLGLFVHSVFLRSGKDQSVREELARLRRAQGELREELDGSIASLRRLEEELGEVRGQAQAGPEVVAEMKVLQTMLQQLFAGNGGKPPGQTAPAAAPAARDGAKPAAGSGDRTGWTPPPRWAPAPGADVLATIKQAIADNRLDVYLQPVVRLPQRKTTYYEALSRLRSAEGSLIEPRIYLQPAEEQGLIGAIDNGLLFRCVQILRLTERKRPDLQIFCNVSGHTVSDTAFFSQFVEFLEENAQLASRLILEFPCDGFLAQTDVQAANLARLNDLGYRFSVDQVSSFEVPARILARHGVAFLKIDAAAVLGRLRREGGVVEARRLRTALAIAGITLIVDKIETEADLIELLDLPIEYGQGFHFGEPRLARETG